MAGSGSGTLEKLVSDTAYPIVAGAFEQVDGSDLGPHHAFPVRKGPRAAHDSGDHVGLRYTLVGDVPVDESRQHIDRDVDVDRTAVPEASARIRPSDDDTILGEEILDHAGMDVPRTPVGPPAELRRHLVKAPVGEHVTQSADLGGGEPGDVAASGEGQ